MTICWRNSWAHAPFDDHRIGATVQYLSCKTDQNGWCKDVQSTSLQSQDFQRRAPGALGWQNYKHSSWNLLPKHPKTRFQKPFKQTLQISLHFDISNWHGCTKHQGTARRIEANRASKSSPLTSSVARPCPWRVWPCRRSQMSWVVMHQGMPCHMLPSIKQHAKQIRPSSKYHHNITMISSRFIKSCQQAYWSKGLQAVLPVPAVENWPHLTTWHSSSQLTSSAYIEAFHVGWRVSSDGGVIVVNLGSGWLKETQCFFLWLRLACNNFSNLKITWLYHIIPSFQTTIGQWESHSNFYSAEGW